MSTLLLDGPVSPELVLVSPPEEAEAARLSLPDYELAFSAWVQDVRRLMEDVPAEEAEPAHERGLLLFTMLVSLNALIPFALVVARHYF